VNAAQGIKCTVDVVLSLKTCFFVKIHFYIREDFRAMVFKSVTQTFKRGQQSS
jgi:hypothetical protein